MYAGNKKVAAIRIGNKRVVRIYKGARIIYDTVKPYITVTPNELNFTPGNLTPQTVYVTTNGNWTAEITDN